MSKLNLIIVAIAFAGVAATANASSPDPEDFQKIYQGTWIQPSESSIPDGEDGDKIRFGRTLLNQTYKYLGAGSQSPIQYSGNKLACTNCHLNDGTKPNSGPWMTSYQKYATPGKYSSRSNEYRTLEVRINGCMQRSMAGSQIPENSLEMKSMVAYFKWLDSGIQVANWQDVLGQSMPSVPDLARAADPVRGAEIYDNECDSCHGKNGEGRWESDDEKFRYPALWGADSFNNAAGMNRLRTAVKFIKHNMPYGKEDLSEEDAWDVAAYMISKNRPVYANQLIDFSGTGPDGMPLWMKKHVDGGYPNFWPRIDGSNDLNQPAMFESHQHKYGPFQPAIAIQKQLQEQWKSQNQ